MCFKTWGHQKYIIFMGLRLGATMKSTIKTKERMIWKQLKKLNQGSKKTLVKTTFFMASTNQ